MMDCDDEDEDDEDDDECDMSPQEKEQRRRIDEADKEYRARLRDLYKEYPKRILGSLSVRSRNKRRQEQIAHTRRSTKCSKSSTTKSCATVAVGIVDKRK